MQVKKVTVPTPTLTSTDWLYLDRGMIPGYRRVWMDGKDVTDRPVSEWPLKAQEGYANGWRPMIDLDGRFMT